MDAAFQFDNLRVGGAAFSFLALATPSYTFLSADAVKRLLLFSGLRPWRLVFQSMELEILMKSLLWASGQTSARRWLGLLHVIAFSARRRWPRVPFSLCTAAP